MPYRLYSLLYIELQTLQGCNILPSTFVILLGIRSTKQTTMDNNFHHKFINPDKSLADFVESFGMFHNYSDEAKEVVVMPDGRIDLFFWQSASTPFRVILVGLETFPEQRSIPPQTLTFVISFKPLAVEYILHTSIADLLNTTKDLSNNFWNFNADDLKNFDAFYKNASQKIKEFLPICRAFCFAPILRSFSNEANLAYVNVTM